MLRCNSNALNQNFWIESPEMNFLKIPSTGSSALARGRDDNMVQFWHSAGIPVLHCPQVVMQLLLDAHPNSTSLPPCPQLILLYESQIYFRIALFLTMACISLSFWWWKWQIPMVLWFSLLSPLLQFRVSLGISKKQGV